MTASSSRSTDAPTSSRPASSIGLAPPPFLSTISPRKKSEALTTTCTISALGEADDAPSSADGDATKDREIEAEGSRPPLQSRIDSAMNTLVHDDEGSGVAGLPEVTSKDDGGTEAPPIVTAGEPQGGINDVASQDELPKASHPAEASQEQQASTSSMPDESQNSSSWTGWTSRAASGSMTLLRQSGTVASGWGAALRTNPFRSLSGNGSEASSSVPDHAKPTPPNAPDEDEEDAQLARSAANALRMGAKNEEKRRRAVNSSGKAKATSKQRKDGPIDSNIKEEASGSTSAPLRGRTNDLRGPASDQSRTPSNPSRTSSPASSTNTAARSNNIKGLNVFDYSTLESNACDAPSESLPERRYFVLTQAGKPVFLSHLAARRIAREAEARERLKTSRKSQKTREDQRQGAPKELYDSLDVQNQESERAEEAARRQDQEASDRDEEDSAVQVGVLQALVSNYHSKGNTVLEEKSVEILELPKGSSRVVYLLKGPLYLAVTSTWHDAGIVYADSLTLLKSHLEVLYAGLLSLISESQLTRLFSRGYNFDLRRMLEGTDGILSTLVARCQDDFGISLAAGGGTGGVCLRPVRMDLKLREDLASCLSLERWENRPLSKALATERPSDSASASLQAIQNDSNDVDPSRLGLDFKLPPRPKDLLYALLFSAEGHLITLLRPKRLSAYPLDLHLLVNTIIGMSRKSQRESGTVNWIPICLPRFAPQGMVQAHVSWLGGINKTTGRNKQAKAEAKDPETSEATKSLAETALVIVTADRESFEEVTTYRDAILHTLQLPPSPLRLLSRSLTTSMISPDELHLPGLHHFVLKKKDDLQIVWSSWIEQYRGEDKEAVLARERVKRGYARGRELCILGAKLSKRGSKKRQKGKELEGQTVSDKQIDQKAASASLAANGDLQSEVKEGGDKIPKQNSTNDIDETTITTNATTDNNDKASSSSQWLPSIPKGLLPYTPDATSSSTHTPHTSQYLHTSHEVIYVEIPPPSVASSTSSSASSSITTCPFEVYLILSPHIPPATARKMAREVVRWGLGTSNVGGEHGNAGVERWRLWVSGRGMVF
jgi:type II secretory pathway pseudopilin PulG